MHAVLLDVAGKQSYIFSTNKLREAVGASELVALSTTDWLCEAIDELPADRRDWVDWVVQASGLALLTVSGTAPEEEAEVCRSLLSTVTTRALRPAGAGGERSGAPGLRLTGAWKALDNDRLRPDDQRELETMLERQRAEGPAFQARLPRLPVVADCHSSGEPAAHMLIDIAGEGEEPLSSVTTAKRVANRVARTDEHTEQRSGPTRIVRRLEQDVNGEAMLVSSRDFQGSLDGNVRWLGVVHADGNGIGALIRELVDLGGEFADNYRKFSNELEECTARALADAIKHLRDVRDRTLPDPRSDRLPLLPLIASGDDLTVLVDGRFAVPFAAEYLRAFERHSRSGTLAEVANRHTAGDGARGLTASAGVAVVKPHFPFSVAYELCEQACRSAKALARQAGTSALDWHVHYDSTGSNLGESPLRQRIDPSPGSGGTEPYARLARPYAVLGEGGTLPDAADGRDWAELQRLIERMPIRPHPEDGEALPSSQMERLRSVLARQGPDAAERLFAQLRNRRELRLLGYLGESLFTEIADPIAGNAQARVRATRLLDLLDGEFLAPHLVRASAGDATSGAEGAA